MNRKVTMAFEAQSLLLQLNNILPVKQLPKTVKASKKYQQILASVREIGIIEPPIIARQKSNSDCFLLLDGHIRIEVLKDLEIERVPCLVSTDDEAFTYNKRINRLATIQEHKMILKAIERGVPESRIAKALNINITSIRKKQKLLDGICPEVATLLKDRHCPVNTFQSLKKMKALRQVEVTDLMITMNNFTVAYANALLAATAKDQLVSPKKTRTIKGVSAEQIEKMENEMANLQREIKLIEDTYGPDHLHLVLAHGYVTSILENSKIESYLMKNHNAILCEFQKMSETMSMGTGTLRKVFNATGQ